MRMTWDAVARISMNLELWETALVVEMMRDKLFELKTDKILICQDLGETVADDMKLVSKKDYNEILEFCVDSVYEKTKKMFYYKNKIIMVALNANQL